MSAPTAAALPIEVRLTAWRRVWEALLTEPPTERTPEPPTADDILSSDTATEAA